MKNFSLDKRGYSVKEVDDYLIMQQIENDRLLKEKQARVNELREENFKLLKELNEFKNKEKTISEALLASTEKANEIEREAKLKYSLELKNLDEFYNKWNNFFNELIVRYPKMRDFDTKSALLNLKTEINNLINGYTHDKTHKESNSFINLLDKLRARSKTINKEKKVLNLNRQDVNKNKIIETENEIEYLTESNKVNKIKPITNLTLSNDEKDEFDSLVDKFLHTNNKISSGYEKSILNKNKKQQGRYPTPNESGFDLEQALNPTDDLMKIMKGFKLD